MAETQVVFSMDIQRLESIDSWLRLSQEAQVSENVDASYRYTRALWRDAKAAIKPTDASNISTKIDEMAKLYNSVLQDKKDIKAKSDFFYKVEDIYLDIITHLKVKGLFFRENKDPSKAVLN